MPEQHDHSTQPSPIEEPLNGSSLRNLSRSPHPYHRQKAELPHARLKPSATFPSIQSFGPTRATSEEDLGQSQATYRGNRLSARSTESDSGTEADDEHFLKGLPAPKWRPHKGLRGGDATFSGTSSPVMTPGILNETSSKGADYLIRGSAAARRVSEDDAGKAADKFRKRRRAELRRRFIEVTLLIAVGGIVVSSHDVRLELRKWKSGMYIQQFPLL
jgi:hypothetical protein